MATDYFTREDFREFAGDRDESKYSGPQIDDAQAEVIEAIEKWAATAWPTLDTTRKGTMTASDATLTLTTGEFATDGSDVGRAIVVVGAGAAGADLSTTIASVTDETHAELADNAGTAVTAVTVRKDGDGTAAERRTATETFDGGTTDLFLGRTPVGSISTFTADGNDIGSTSYYLYEDEALIRSVTSFGAYPRGIIVGYEYGFTETPQTIKRAAMRATKSLLEDISGKNIPSRVSRYTTEGTTFERGNDATIFTRPEPPPVIFSWDPDASAVVADYWAADRPRTVGAL